MSVRYRALPRPAGSLGARGTKSPPSVIRRCECGCAAGCEGLSTSSPTLPPRRGSPSGARGPFAGSGGETSPSSGETSPSRGETLRPREHTSRSHGETSPSREEALSSRGETWRPREETLRSRGVALRSRGETSPSRGEAAGSRIVPPGGRRAGGGAARGRRVGPIRMGRRALSRRMTPMFTDGTPAGQVFIGVHRCHRWPIHPRAWRPRPPLPPPTCRCRSRRDPAAPPCPAPHRALPCPVP